MPKHLAEKIVDHVRLDARAPLGEVLETTLEAMKRQNERTDREKVDAAVGGYRAGGLGVVGPEDTLEALMKRQVEELLITASVHDLQRALAERAAGGKRRGHLRNRQWSLTVGGRSGARQSEVVRLADELVTQAKQTSARITFIEDTALLAAPRRSGRAAAIQNLTHGAVTPRSCCVPAFAECRAPPRSPTRSCPTTASAIRRRRSLRKRGIPST